MTDREAMKAALAEALNILDEVGIDRDSRMASTAMAYLLGGPVSNRASGHDSSQGDSAPIDSRQEVGSIPDGSPVARLGQWADIDPLILEDAIYEQDDQVIVQVNPDRLPRSKAGMQRALGYAFLAVMRQGYEVTDVPADHLNELLREYDVLDQNVWKNLEAETGAFSRRGDRGSYTYRLTIQGLQRARDVLRELLGAS